MIQGIIGGICVRLPVSWIMSKIEPVSLFRIGLATPISTVIQIILCVGFFVVVGRKLKKNQKTIQIEEPQKFNAQGSC
jgi:Na+-driven multidrug efflux pump